MSEITTAKVVRGQRYSEEAKAEIIEFVNQYNLENGRGGNTAAVKKYGISQITIASWMKGKDSVSSAKSVKGSLQNKLELMLSLGNEIVQLERDLKAKTAKFEALKSSL